MRNPVVDVSPTTRCLRPGWRPPQEKLRPRYLVDWSSKWKRPNFSHSFPLLFPTFFRFYLAPDCSYWFVGQLHRTARKEWKCFFFVSCSADSIRNLPADEGVLASEPQRPSTGLAPQEIVAETGRPRSVVEFSPGLLNSTSVLTLLPQLPMLLMRCPDYANLIFPTKGQGLEECAQNISSVDAITASSLIFLSSFFFCWPAAADQGR